MLFSIGIQKKVGPNRRSRPKNSWFRLQLFCTLNGCEQNAAIILWIREICTVFPRLFKRVPQDSAGFFFNFRKINQEHPIAKQWENEKKETKRSASTATVSLFTHPKGWFFHFSHMKFHTIFVSFAMVSTLPQPNLALEKSDCLVEPFFLKKFCQNHEGVFLPWGPWGRVFTMGGLHKNVYFKKVPETT